LHRLVFGCLSSSHTEVVARADAVSDLALLHATHQLALHSWKGLRVELVYELALADAPSIAVCAALEKGRRLCRLKDGPR